MKRIVRATAITALCIVILTAGGWYCVFVWPVSHHRDAASETGIKINAAALVESFEKNEQAANGLYLDKTLEIAGEVATTKINQAGKMTITLKGPDPMAGVLCTLKTGLPVLKEGDRVTLKGICTGFLSDVVVTDAVLTTENKTAPPSSK